MWTTTEKGPSNTSCKLNTYQLHNFTSMNWLVARRYLSKTVSYLVRTMSPRSSFAHASLKCLDPTCCLRFSIKSRTVSLRSTLWLTSVHNIVPDSYWRMLEAKPGQIVNLHNSRRNADLKSAELVLSIPLQTLKSDILEFNHVLSTDVPSGFVSLLSYGLIFCTIPTLSCQIIHLTYLLFEGFLRRKQRHQGVKFYIATSFTFSTIINFHQCIYEQ